ncbi:hypothetical protein C8F01DRAFT_1250977 [Mycena amicta]|nr:hypothetical protein C8F01DRAFT_1250977 [Mycena amicta]
MPPSLRRSSSSPSVRSSAAPYPAGMLPPRSGHRRSTASETSFRRVPLQDIEWWRVTDGQLLFAEEEDQPPDGAGAGRPATPLELPVAEMAALAIAPPTTPIRHGQESSSSSVESSPNNVQAEQPFFEPSRDAIPPALRRSRSDTSPAMLLSTFEDLAGHEHQYADFATSPLSSPLVFSH